MKVDILGRGPIPGLNSIAPSYNADLSLPELEKIVKVGALRPVVAGTNIAIHRRNLDEIFKVYSSTADDTPVVKTEAPKKVAKKVKKGVKTPNVKDCVAANSNVINTSSTISEVRLPSDPRPFSGTFRDIAGDF